ncbi:DUF1310 family protein [Streptococcus uberis]|uniref:DUF1310 family protein n=1 Tax=Streptococcus uberis TaxID=1349 RepID=UPI000542BC63|nr:DUF1310 family protein [Streptococcus uberis]KHD39063.1 hypothetical protein NA32_09715 [Streptococcus hongkongensis]SQG45607.1 Lmo2805 protein [Streptococcus uberis]
MNFKKIIYILLGLLIAVGILVGGHKLQEKREYDQMVEIVESKEAKLVFEKTIFNIEPKAFKDGAIIQKYKIDKDSIKHNPMGGINVTLIINNDKTLKIYSLLNRESDGKLVEEGGGYSKNLVRLLEKKNDSIK